MDDRAPWEHCHPLGVPGDLTDDPSFARDSFNWFGKTAPTERVTEFPANAVIRSVCSGPCADDSFKSRQPLSCTVPSRGNSVSPPWKRREAEGRTQHGWEKKFQCVLECGIPSHNLANKKGIFCIASASQELHETTCDSMIESCWVEGCHWS